MSDKNSYVDELEKLGLENIKLISDSDLSHIGVNKDKIKDLVGGESKEMKRFEDICKEGSWVIADINNHKLIVADLPKNLGDRGVVGVAAVADRLFRMISLLIDEEKNIPIVIIDASNLGNFKNPNVIKYKEAMRYVLAPINTLVILGSGNVAADGLGKLAAHILGGVYNKNIQYVSDLKEAISSLD